MTMAMVVESFLSQLYICTIAHLNHWKEKIETHLGKIIKKISVKIVQEPNIVFI